MAWKQGQTVRYGSERRITPEDTDNHGQGELEAVRNLVFATDNTLFSWALAEPTTDSPLSLIEHKDLRCHVYSRP